MSIEYPHGKATIWPEDPEQPPVRAYVQPAKNHNYNARWLVVWQDGSEIGVSMAEQAQMEKPLTQTEYRVRDYLMGTIGLGNFVYVNQAEVARKLNVRRASVCEAIKRLISLQILLQGPKSGKSNAYMVNPAFCFAGKLGVGVQQRKEAIKQGKAKVIQFQESQE